MALPSSLCSVRADATGFDGGLTRSASGGLLAFPCYQSMSVGALVNSTTALQAPRIVALVGQSAVNMQHGLIDGFNASSIPLSAFVDDSGSGSVLRFWVTGSLQLLPNNATDGGLRFFTNASSRVGGRRNSTRLHSGIQFRSIGGAPGFPGLIATYSHRDLSVPGGAFNAIASKLRTAAALQGVSRVIAPGNATNNSSVFTGLPTAAIDDGAWRPWSSNSSSGDRAAPDLGQVLFTSGASMWTADCVWGLNQYAYTAANNSWGWVSFNRPTVVTGQLIGFRWLTAQRNASGAIVQPPVIYAVACSSDPAGPTPVWAFNSGTGEWTQLLPRPNEVITGVIKGIGASPYDPVLSNSTSSSVAQLNLTATPTATTWPSPSASPTIASGSPAVNAFQLGSIVVTRTSIVPRSRYFMGQPLPVYLDELHPNVTGLTISSRVLPTRRGSTDTMASCYLSYGNQSEWLFEAEGQPRLTTDGASLVIPCYDANVAGAPAQGDLPLSALYRKAVVVLNADGTVDSWTSLGDAYQAGSAAFPQALRSAIAINGSSGFFLAGSGAPYDAGVANSGSGGIRFAALGSRFSVPLIGFPDAPFILSEARAAQMFGGRLYFAASRKGAAAAGFIGGGLFGLDPAGLTSLTMSIAVSLVPLPGTNVSHLGTATDIHSFVIEAPEVLWVADDSNRGSWNILRFVSSAVTSPLDPGTRWAVPGPIASAVVSLDTRDPVYSLTGRYETVGAFRQFVLYASTPYRVYKAAPFMGRTWTLAVAPELSTFHGVAFAPYSSSILLPRSPSAVPTPSQSATVSGSSTVSPGANVSVSPSVAPSSDASATGSPVMQFNTFGARSILVLRAGDQFGNYTVGRAIPMYIDELDPKRYGEDGSPAIPVSQSLPLTASLPSSAPNCAAIYGWEGDLLPSLSGNGYYLTVPCYDRPTGSTPTSGDGARAFSGMGKVVTLLRYDVGQAGYGPTIALRLPDAYTYGSAASGSNLLHSAYTADGTGFWLTGSTGIGAATPDSGVRFASLGSNASSPIVYPQGAVDSRVCGADTAGFLHCTLRDGNAAFGLFNTSSRRPTAAAIDWSGVFSPLTFRDISAQMSSGFPWSFVFESQSRVWMTTSDDPSLPPQLALYELYAPTNKWYITFAGATEPYWDVAPGEPLYSLVGRSEPAGDLPLSETGGVTGLSSVFYLYAASPKKVYQFNTLTRALPGKVLYRAQGSSVFKGVVLPPLGALPRSPSGTPSPSGPPVTRTRTGSVTTTGSVTGTATGSATSSGSATATGTATHTVGVSGSVTNSGTRSGTGTASKTPTSSITPSRTATASGTGTIRQNQFWDSYTVVVLRGGDGVRQIGTLDEEATMLPLYFDEYNLYFTAAEGNSPQLSFKVPSSPGDLSAAVNADGVPNRMCTLPYDLFPTEGVLSVSADGSGASFFCYEAGNYTSYSPSIASGLRRVAAWFRNDGTLDTRTSCADCYINSASQRPFLRAAVADNVTQGFFVSGVISDTTGPIAPPTAGIRWLPFGGSASQPVSNTSWAYLRGAQIYDFGGSGGGSTKQLVFSGYEPGRQGILALPPGLPTGSSQIGTLLPGFELLQDIPLPPVPFGFSFENRRRLWVLDSRERYTGGIWGNSSIQLYERWTSDNKWHMNEAATMQVCARCLCEEHGSILQSLSCISQA